MIEVKHLSKRYITNESYTIKDINLTLPDTGLFYIVGKSGSGKSTILNILGLIDEDYEGSVKIDGIELKDMSEDEKAMYRFSQASFVFQSYFAQDDETVKQNLLKALAISSLSSKEKEERITKRLKEVSLSDKKDSLFKTLSGGEKKRISLVRSLIKDSKILFVDEPLSNLNSKLRKQITEILFNESKKKLVLIITHEKEEIPTSANIFEIKNGNLVKKTNQEINNKKSNEITYNRKPFFGLPFFSQLLSTFKSKNEFLIITLFSLMIGLFAISFSFQLSGSVSKALQESMSSYMDENSLVISNRDSILTNTNFKNADYASINTIYRNHKDDIIAISPFYTTTFDTIFGNNQSIIINYDNKRLKIPKLSLNSFLEYRMIEELSEEKTIYGEEDIEYEDVILALDVESMLALYSLIFDEALTKIEENDLIMLSNQIIKEKIQLEVKANKEEWKYYQDDSFLIKGIFLDDECYIIHSKSDFSSNFVTERMQFLELSSYDAIDSNKPWALKKSNGVRVYPKKVSNFLELFLIDKDCISYVPRIIKTNNYYQKNKIETHNHIAIDYDYLSKINLNEINSFINDHQKSIQSVCYSSPIYTYTASGYISGFSKPFFFSKYKDKLNSIQDEAEYSTENLGSFQGSLIKDMDGVIKADLLSSMNQETGLNFQSLDNYEVKPYYGKKPNNYLEVGISKGMAIQLFGSASQALNKTLYTLTLNDTVQLKENQYRNEFVEGEIRISGIYDEDKTIIYQSSLFPLCYSFLLGELTLEETRINEAVIKVDLTNNTIDYFLNEIKKYGNYKGSFPMYNIILEIKKTLNQLSMLFLGFSILSLISASCLLTLSLYLILVQNRKEIGTFLSLGYTKKEISFFYLVFCQLIGLIGFLFSIIITIITELIMKKTLINLLNSYTFSIQPILISFFVSFSLTTIIGISLSFMIRKLSVKDAFEKIHS